MFGMIFPVALIIIIVLLAVLVFEVWMFVHAWRNASISDETRILWLIGMLLLHPIVAAAYFLTDYKKDI